MKTCNIVTALISLFAIAIDRVTCSSDSIKPDFIPLFRYSHPSTGDHLYQTPLSELGTGYSDYRSEGNIGYLSTGPHPDYSPLYRYEHPESCDHIFTTLAEHRNSYSGYILEEVVGYVGDFPGANFLPIHSYYNPAIPDHFYTNSYDEIGSGEGNGYEYEGIIGYSRVEPSKQTRRASVRGSL